MASMITTVTLNTAIDRIVEVEGFSAGAHNRGRLIRVVPAGKGVNVSRVLAQLGVGSAATGFVGQREETLFRESLDGLASSGRVSENFVPVAGFTRTNTTIVDPASGRDTHIRERGFAVTGAEKERLLARLGGCVAEGDTVVFSGSLPLGFCPADLDRLVAEVGLRSGRAVIDCPDGGIACARKRRAWAVKPNREELAEAAGRPLLSIGEVVEAARELAADISVVLVSLGADGAVAVSGTEAICATLAPSAAGAVNTVGAGDAFLAGWLAAWTEKGDIEWALRMAVASGGSKVMHVGSSDVDPAYVREAAPKVTVRKL